MIDPRLEPEAWAWLAERWEWEATLDRLRLRAYRTDRRPAPDAAALAA